MGGKPLQTGASIVVIIGHAANIMEGKGREPEGEERRRKQERGGKVMESGYFPYIRLHIEHTYQCHKKYGIINTPTPSSSSYRYRIDLSYHISKFIRYSLPPSNTLQFNNNNISICISEYRLKI